MQRNFSTILFSTAVTFLLAVSWVSSTQAQMFGMPPAKKDNVAWKEITGLLPDDQPLACWVWNEAGALDPNGNPSEKWFANKDLQKSLGKLKRAIVTAATENAPPEFAAFAEDIGWKMLASSGSIVIDSIDIEGQTGKGSLIVGLGEDEAQIRDWLDGRMADAGIPSAMVGADKTYAMPETPIPIVVGIHAGHLIAAAGDDHWKSMIDRIDQKNGQPQWLKQRLEKLPISRRSQFWFADISAMLKLLPPQVTEEPEFQRISKTLSLEGMKFVSVSLGTDSVSNVSQFHIECDKQGLTSVMDVPPIDKNKLKEIPADALVTIALKFSPENLMKMVKASVPAEQFEEGMKSFSEETNLDLEKDIIDHLEGTIRYYNAGSVIAPKQIGIFKLKDERKFLNSLREINAAVEHRAVQQGLEFTDSLKKGLQIFGVKNAPTSVYWAVNEGELYISSNSRAISSHIRNAAKEGQATLLDSELAKEILTQADSQELEGPIGLQHYDLDPIIEVGVPAIQAMFVFIPAEYTDAFDFGADDIPPIESLLGLRSTRSMLFKSASGYTGISRYDTPAPLELSTIAVSGVAIGMLLPAVQAVREAARRTQSLNNQRELVLSLLNYESTHGHFPPAFTADADGKPLLSWRVEILPFIGEEELYDDFNHDEPWDSEHNIKLLDRMPVIFRNPSSALDRPGYSDYVAPVCKDSVLTAGKGVKIGKITDGTSNTVLLMEVGTSQQVPWSAPQDLDIDNLKTLIMDNGHPGSVLCAFCDGSTHVISNQKTVDDFQGCCRKSDGVRATAVLLD